MPLDFATFINQISYKTRYDRGLLQRFLEQQIYNKNQIKCEQFELYFRAEWENWEKETKKSENVAGFFVKKGELLLRKWLNDFFPFNTGKQQLILGFKGGGTSEDFRFYIFYRFTTDELEIIEKSFINYKIREISQRAAITRIFLEIFLAMSPIISKVLGYKYSLMLEESKILSKSKARILYLELVARPLE